MSADDRVDGLSDAAASSPAEGPPEDASAPQLEPSPFDCLELSTPPEEFEAFVRARLAALASAGDAARVERTRAALEVGLRALREVMAGGRRSR